MGTDDDKKLAWDKGKEISFTLKDCSISGSALDSLKEGEVCYESSTGESYMGTITGYKPIRIAYEETPYSFSTVIKEQEQIETLIRAVTNLIKEVEGLKEENKCLEVENEGLRADVNNLLRTSSALEAENKELRNSMEEMYIEMVAIKDKIIILDSRKADKEPVRLETSTLASCC